MTDTTLCFGCGERKQYGSDPIYGRTVVTCACRSVPITLIRPKPAPDGGRFEMRQCVQCPTMFRARKYRPTKTCSPECRAEWAALQNHRRVMPRPLRPVELLCGKLDPNREAR